MTKLKTRPRPKWNFKDVKDCRPPPLPPSSDGERSGPAGEDIIHAIMGALMFICVTSLSALLFLELFGDRWMCK